MIAIMRNVSMTCTLLTVLACSAPAPAQQQAGTPPGGGEVAARVGDRTITMQEVDERWQRAQPAARAQAIQQLYDGRKEALDAIINDMLIEQAAKSRGLNPTQYADGEIARRVKPVTEADIIAFFQENQSQMQGRGLAAMTTAIRSYLEQQQRTVAYQSLVAELRRAGPAISLVLDAPRYEVAVADDDPALGPANAPVTLVEFSDFQCPFCLRLAPTLKRLRDTYGDRIRLVWKDYPLTQIHPEAFKAAEAAHCAREQGKFWEYHDVLFANQQALLPQSLKQYAADLGLNATAFNTCLDTSKHNDRVQQHMGIGNGLGVNSTPATFVNGRLVTGAQPYEVFVAIIDEELQRASAR
jgi:protein-disulfide isomerase